MAGLKQRATKAHDPASRYGADKKIAPASGNPLDTEEMQDLAKQFEQWWIEARDKHAQNRMERFLDHNYYDHDQISPEDRAVYDGRKQAPVVFNLVHGAIDWLSGTERRTRVDWDVQPRGPEDEQGAKAQKQVLKYVSDANRAGWERSRAFKDAVISGVGFVEEFLRKDKSQEPVGYGYVDWRYLWWDPYSRDLDFGDARYFHRVKFTDLDRAVAMFPNRAADLKAIAVNTVDDDFELMDEIDGLPAMFSLSGNGNFNALRTGTGIRDRHARQRVRLIETWYPRAQVSKEVVAEIADCCDLAGLTYDATNAQLREKLDAGHISLSDAITTRMHMGIWSPGLGICQAIESPYKHNLLPFTASWCYRHHRDGMPYGYVRGMRDAQDEYNKRRAKALFSASVNRVLFEEDAFAEDDERESLDQISMPNGEVRLAPGGLGKVKIDTGLDVSQTHVAFQLEAKEHIYEGNGITRENLGQTTNAISGRAIVAKQQQGAVTTAEVFDLFRLFIEISGQKLLEVCKQGMSQPRQIRVLGGNEGMEWLAINQPFYNHETGQVEWENDILNTLADFKVGEQDFRETLRMAMAESLFETIGKLPPEIAMQLIDLAVELTDLPNKAEFIARVRKINGTTPAPVDPAEAEAQAAAQQHEARLRQIAEEGAAAKVERDRAAAQKDRAAAKRVGVQGQREAVDAAGLIAAALPIAPMADTLYAGAGETPPSPVPPGVAPQ